MLRNLHASGHTLREVATAMGISPPYLSDLTRGNRLVDQEIERRFKNAIKQLDQQPQPSAK
jgi:transcriptional regulator with XRE-family HTH domain